MKIDVMTRCHTYSTAREMRFYITDGESRKHVAIVQYYQRNSHGYKREEYFTCELVTRALEHDIVLPFLYELSEEELFQMSTVWDFDIDMNLLLKVQKYFFNAFWDISSSFMNYEAEMIWEY